MTVRWLIGTTLLLALATLIASSGLRHPHAPAQGHQQHLEHPLSIIRLIANPDAFDHQEVTVIGYFLISRVAEGDGLMTSPTDAKHNLALNAVHIDLSPGQRVAYRCMNGSYAVVTGVFHAPPPVSFSLWAGSIDQITEVWGWDPYRLDGCKSK